MTFDRTLAGRGVLHGRCRQVVEDTWVAVRSWVEPAGRRLGGGTEVRQGLSGGQGDTKHKARDVVGEGTAPGFFFLG